MLSANNGAHIQTYGDREAQLPAHAPEFTPVNADASPQNWVRLARHRQGQAGLAQIKRRKSPLAVKHKSQAQLPERRG